MARIFITGSSDGIGQGAAKLLSEQGHKVWLHARNQSRANEAKQAVPQAEGVLIGDLSSIEDTKRLADEANKNGPWDSVVHNAALGPSNSLGNTKDGLASTFHVNSLAPYILTALMDKPKRLLYLSSGLHAGGSDNLKDIAGKKPAFQAYSDSKVHDIMLANAVARHWPDVQSCSLDPGWIKTKLGGGGAPGVVSTPAKTIAEYAAGQSGVFGDKTGTYGDPHGVKTPHKGAVSEAKQEEFLKICEQLSGVAFPQS
ncbi:hypothetical protein DOTSEDRAFT_20466 [Dothistroma septosporum NZE10]|uniref:Uncharacterized protein n=1 Tax=Dothistroma septosporum (strain NZE10 / CBS 128990) TaxID=675120 RepID=N1Q486_DOTSN|nr:hypothetical protein DOTSEDRAFT_20466 [Dothistroma septosporum NZE10]